MKQIKVGLIGCGGMAATYREIYSKIEGVKLDFIVGLESDHPEMLAKELGCSRWSTDFMDCINSDVDVIDISTPNHLHCKQFVEAIKRGKHILLQKPIAASEKDAIEILNASKATDKKVGMFMMRHSATVYNEMRKMVQNGVIGKVSSVHARTANMNKGPKQDPAKNWRSSLELTGGGSLMQLGVHNYDLLQWILGEKIIKLSAFCNNLMTPHIGGDDTAQTIVAFESGIAGCVESSYCAEGNRVEIFGSEGYLLFNDERILSVKSKNKYEGDYVKYAGDNTVVQYELPYTSRELFKVENPYEQHIAFINAVKNDTLVPVTIDEGFDAFVIVKAAYEASKTGKVINIEEFKNLILERERNTL